MQIRLATVKVLADTNAQAFRDDPLIVWLFPHAKRRTAILRWYYQVNIRDLIRSGEVWCSDDRVALAKWQPPGSTRISFARALRLFAAVPVLFELGPSLPSAFRAMQTVERHRPEQPHWYLSGLGTHPDYQRRGYASALLTVVLKRCDDAGLPAYLETGRPENVVFYRRFGFEESGELLLSSEGPKLWTMTRTAC
jgi:GNAT superfamily N-acetyltransferase